MISGIIMASGFSNRMGQNKLLLEIEGVKVIERVIKACKDSLLDEVILIYRLDEIKQIGEKYGIKTIFNPNADKGQSAAVKLGVESSKITNGYMFLVGDQPFLNSSVINALIEECRKNKESICVPYYKEKFGMPILFSPIYKNDLLNVKGDKGGREIIKNNPNMVKRLDFNDEYLGLDIDTMDDYVNLLNKKN